MIKPESKNNLQLDDTQTDKPQSPKKKKTRVMSFIKFYNGENVNKTSGPLTQQ
jgi:hypothetical protein